MLSPMTLFGSLELAANGAILTKENLRKRRFTYDSWCFMCESAGVNVGHLLLHCKVANWLWRVVPNLFRMQWVMPDTVKEALQIWTHRRGKRSSRAWRFAPLAIMWSFGKGEIGGLLKGWSKIS